VNKPNRFRFLLAILIVFFGTLSIAAFKAYNVFYDQILEQSETWHLRVEEVSGTSPLQIRITTDPYQSAAVIRRVTISRRDDELTVLYHLAIAVLAKPSLNWGKPYTLTVPNSVSEVRFGHRAEVIWRRSGPSK
jgi:hypothetical protein